MRGPGTENAAHTLVVDAGISKKGRKAPRVRRYHIEDEESGERLEAICESIDNGTCWWGDYLNMQSGVADSLAAAHDAFIVDVAPS